MQNIMLKIAYNGTNYNGWQKQKSGTTVQGVIEALLCEILNEEVKLTASGRTDSGVSAIGQVANFTTNSKITPFVLMGRLNATLPADIRILHAQNVKLEFNSRFSAKRKTYSYSFYVSQVLNPYYEMFATQVKVSKEKFNFELFSKNLNQIVGTHDFTSFCAANTEVEDKVRTIENVTLSTNGHVYTVSITGNGFLYNMVRIIMGTLFDIACGKINKSINEILQSKNRTNAGKTASAKGLLLVDVEYNEQDLKI